MSRHPRQQSRSNYYHIMLRGINRQNIFEDDDDRARFIDTVFRFTEDSRATVTAWCLMSNHVHLLICSESIPDTFMKKIGCSYVPYFNKKYERTGHLFQDRYRSEVITDEHYLVGVVRYIHRNPEKAGISTMENYRWSSYRDYVGNDGKTETQTVLDILSGESGFVKFMHESDDTEFLDDNHSLSEKTAVSIAKETLPDGLFSLENCDKETRNKHICELYEKGLKASQICRITGLSKNIVYGVLK